MANEPNKPQIDPYSPTWRAIKEWGEKRRESSRATIEAPGVDERTADYERGRLAAIRELLALPEPRPGVHPARDEE